MRRRIASCSPVAGDVLSAPSAIATSAPAATRWRAAARPPPPFPPGPASTTTCAPAASPPSSSRASRATLRPAFSIKRASEIPSSSTSTLSSKRTSATESQGSSGRRAAPLPVQLDRLLERVREALDHRLVAAHLAHRLATRWIELRQASLQRDGREEDAAV